MRRITTVGLALLLATTAGACGDPDDPEEDAIEVPEESPPLPSSARTDPPTATVRFEAGEALDHVAGLARLYEGDELVADMAAGPGVEPISGFRVDVILDGIPTGEHAWHIRRGGCDEQGPVAVAIAPTAEDPGLTGPLTVSGEDAPARGSAYVPDSILTLEAAREGGYTLHVHERAGEIPGRTIACADLSGEDNPTM